MMVLGSTLCGDGSVATVNDMDWSEIVVVHAKLCIVCMTTWNPEKFEFKFGLKDLK